VVLIVLYTEACNRFGKIHDLNKGVADVLRDLLQRFKEEIWALLLVPPFLRLHVHGELSRLEPAILEYNPHRFPSLVHMS